MAEVVSSGVRVTEIVKDFHRAAQQHSDGIAQVSRAVEANETVAQQNVALVESMSQGFRSAARHKGTQLMSAVDLFQLGDEVAAAGSRAATLGPQLRETVDADYSIYDSVAR